MTRQELQRLREVQGLRNELFAALERGDDTEVRRLLGLAGIKPHPKALPAPARAGKVQQRKKWAKVADEIFANDKLAAALDAYYVPPLPGERAPADPTKEAQLMVEVSRYSGRGTKPLTAREYDAMRIVIVPAYSAAWLKGRNAEYAAQQAADAINKKYLIDIKAREVRWFIQQALSPEQRVKLFNESAPATEAPRRRARHKRR